MQRTRLPRPRAAGVPGPATLTLGFVLLCAPPAWAQHQQLLRTSWSENVTQYRGQDGRRVTLICPPGGQISDAVWGTDSYSDDSYVCSAAVHAGLIGVAKGGAVTIVIGPAANAYVGSTRNGVTSKSFGKVSGSFGFDRANAEGRIDWVTRVGGLSLAGTPLTVVCPPGGKSESVWGTDSYTDDSSICTAAVHAGRITFASGGRVTIEDAGTQAAYVASDRNGVSSKGYSGGPNSFRVSTAVAAKAPAAGSVTSLPGATAAAAGSAPAAPLGVGPATGAAVARAGAAPTAGRRRPSDAVTPEPPVATNVPTGPIRATAADPAAAPATNLKALATSNGIVLSWTAPPLAHGYSITRREQVNGVWTSTKIESGKILTATTYTDANVVYGRTYGYRLTTHFKGASGNLYSPPEASEAGVAASPRRMGPTQITFVAYANGSGTVDFRYTPAPGASAHKLLRGPFPPSPTEFAEPRPGTSYADAWARDYSPKPTGQKYTYRIRATFPDGEQIDSDNVVVGIPAAPTGATYVTATALGGGRVEIKWVHDGRAIAYDVWRWRGTNREQMFRDLNRFQPTLTDVSLMPGQTYRYSVIAKYADANASATADVTVTAR